MHILKVDLNNYFYLELKNEKKKFKIEIGSARFLSKNLKKPLLHSSASSKNGFHRQ